MSARSRRAPRPGPGTTPGGPPEFAWMALVLAAALIGGLAAAALVHASLIIAVVVAVVATAIAVLALRMAAATPRGDEAYGPPVAPFPGAPADVNPPPAAPLHASPPPETPVQPPASPAPAETMVQMLPLPPQPGQEPRSADAPWWDPAPGAASRPSPAARRVPAPDLTTYLASTFIAQCPRCGAFRLDIRQAMNAWDFRCEACEYTWAWRPGTAWPPVRVTPGRRRESHPPAS